MNPFHCVKLKKHFQSQSRVLGMCHFWVRNDPFALNKFFWYKPLLLTSSTYWQFSVCKIFKKHSCSRSRVMRTHTFWIQNGSFAPIFFFGKNYEYYFHIPTGPICCDKFKKNSESGSRVMTMHHFLGHKWLICNNKNLFQKTC